MLLPEEPQRLVPGSSWGTFTIACTIPIALFVGWYMYRFRKGKVVEASLIGAAAVLAATVAGAWITGSQFEPYFSLSRDVTISALAVYGFVAAVLPVWLLLCPRDYLSSFLKIGTIVAAGRRRDRRQPAARGAGGQPPLRRGRRARTSTARSSPMSSSASCAARSPASTRWSPPGTTPKMVDKERDVRMIGYGAMLMEGLVGIVALIAAAALPNSMYYDINIDLASRPQFLAEHPDFAQFLKVSEADPHGHGDGAAPAASPLAAMEQDVQESLHGRTGGAVTLAVGMARIFTDALPGMKWLIVVLVPLRDHVRGPVHPDDDRRRDADRPVPGAGVPRQALETPGRPQLAAGRDAGDRPGRVRLGLFHLHRQSVDTIWPMFGMANQLLAVIALASSRPGWSTRAAAAMPR